MLSFPLIEVRSQNTGRVFNSLLHGDCSVGYSIGQQDITLGFNLGHVITQV